MDAITKRMQENLLWYVRIRYFLAFILLGAGIGATLVLIGYDFVVLRSLVLGAIILGANTLLWLLCRLENRSLTYYKSLAFAQFFLDVLVISYLVYAEGNIQQYAIVLYALPIVISGFLFDRAVTILNAALVAAMFSTLTIWEEFGYRPFDLAANFAPHSASYDFLIPILFYSAVFIMLALVSERISDFRHQSVSSNVREEILSLATHELRTPATAVKGYLALLRESLASKLDAKQLKRLESAMDENNQQLRLVNNLLHTAMLDSTSSVVNYNRVSLTSVLRRVAADQRYFASHKEVKVNVSSQDVEIEADEDSLMVIFSNLLHNALKYSPYKSQVDISISADGRRAKISFVDYGPGMSRSDKQRLFKRFSGINRDDKVAGTGLGLYIAKILTDKHNGRIGVNSQKGQGSEFFVELPIKKETSNEISTD